jgi:hypothetical protein
MAMRLAVGLGWAVSFTSSWALGAKSVELPWPVLSYVTPPPPPLGDDAAWEAWLRVVSA